MPLLASRGQMLGNSLSALRPLSWTFSAQNLSFSPACWTATISTFFCKCQVSYKHVEILDDSLKVQTATMRRQVLLEINF